MPNEPEITPGVNHQTGTSYTIHHSDREKLVTLFNSSPIAVTVPQATVDFGFGFRCTVLNLGTGAATLTPTTSTVNGASSLVLSQGQSAVLLSDGTNWDAELPGAKGDKGDQGIQGETGPTGPQGPVGPNIVVALVDTSAQTADISIATLYDPAAAGVYEIGYFLRCVAAGTGDATLTVHWTESGISRTEVVTCGLTDTALRVTGNFTIKSNASIIQYDVATTASGGAEYKLTLSAKVIAL